MLEIKFVRDHKVQLDLPGGLHVNCFLCTMILPSVLPSLM